MGATVIHVQVVNTYIGVLSGISSALGPSTPLYVAFYNCQLATTASQDSPRIYQGFTKDLLRICQGFAKDMLRIWQGFAKDLLRIC